MRLLSYLKKDERKAPRDYHKLLHQVKGKHDKRIIKGIIRDERRHAKLLRRIKLK